MPNTDPNCKESARGGEELLLLVMGLFFSGGEILISVVDGEWDCSSLVGR